MSLAHKRGTYMHPMLMLKIIGWVVALGLVIYLPAFTYRLGWKRGWAEGLIEGGRVTQNQERNSK